MRNTNIQELIYELGKLQDDLIEAEKHGLSFDEKDRLAEQLAFLVYRIRRHCGLTSKFYVPAEIHAERKYSEVYGDD